MTTQNSTWHTIIEDIKPEAHAHRHQDGGADEINIKGLDGIPNAITAIQTYYGVVQTYLSEVQTSETA